MHVPFKNNWILKCPASPKRQQCSFKSCLAVIILNDYLPYSFRAVKCACQSAAMIDPGRRMALVGHPL